MCSSNSPAGAELLAPRPVSTGHWPARGRWMCWRDTLRMGWQNLQSRCLHIPIPKAQRVKKTKQEDSKERARWARTREYLYKHADAAKYSDQRATCRTIMMIKTHALCQLRYAWSICLHAIYWALITRYTRRYKTLVRFSTLYIGKSRDSECKPLVRFCLTLSEIKNTERMDRTWKI